MQKIKNKIKRFFIYQFESFFHLDSTDTDIQANYPNQANFSNIIEILEKKNVETLDIIHIDSIPSIVPQKHFEKNILKNYLKTNISSFEKIIYDTTNDTKINVVYSINESFYNLFINKEKNYRNINYFTHIYNFLSKVNISKEQSFFINLNDKSFYILIFNKGEFIFFNKFKINDKNDFLYYLFFVVKNFESLNDKEKIIFLGKFNRYNDYYKSASKFSKIDFIENNNFSLLEYKSEYYSVLNENHSWT
tara:strand:- start:20888 stop:21634 length:747 start_codon:yes stop_codon:yes gene_type:complete